MGTPRQWKFCDPDVHDALAMGPREAWLAGTVPLPGGVRTVHEGLEYALCRRCVGALGYSTSFVRFVECWVCRTPVDGPMYCSAACEDADAPRRAELACERARVEARDAAVPEEQRKERHRRHRAWRRVEAVRHSKTLRTAHHEASHAVADVRFDFGCDGVDIRPDERNLGTAQSVYGPSIDGDDDHLAVVAHLAGYAAEVVCFDGSTVEMEGGAASDIESARDLLERTGRGSRFDEWLSCALTFASVEERAIRLIASELLMLQHLSGDEVAILVDIADGEATHVQLAEFRALVPRR